MQRLVILFHHHLSDYLIDLVRWVSTESGKETDVWWEKRLNSLDWSLVHQPVISLRQNVFACQIDWERWVSKESSRDQWEGDGHRLLNSLRWSSVHQLVISLLQHQSGCPIDQQRSASAGNCSEVSVWWDQIVALTWFILSASASDLAPSEFSELFLRLRVVSVYRKC